METNKCTYRAEKNMKFSTLKAFQKHLQGASPLHLCSVYVILAKDEHSQKIALDDLLPHLLPKSALSELSMTTLSAERLKPQELMHELGSLSLFVQKRTVLLKNVEKLTKVHLEILKDYFTRTSEGLTLVMSGASLPKEASFYKKLEKLAVLLDLSDQKPWDKEKEMIEWVHDYLKAEGKLISPGLSQRLVKAAGQEVTLLKNELDKLICYIDKRQEITTEDILAIGALEAHFTIWQLATSVLEKKGKEALNIATMLLKDGVSLIALLRQLRNQFHQRYQLLTVLERGGGLPEAASTFPQLKPNQLHLQMHQAKVFGGAALEKGLLLIDEAELKAKSGSTSDTLLLEQLIIRILT